MVMMASFCRASWLWKRTAICVVIVASLPLGTGGSDFGSEMVAVDLNLTSSLTQLTKFGNSGQNLPQISVAMLTDY